MEKSGETESTWNSAVQILQRESLNAGQMLKEWSIQKASMQVTASLVRNNL